MILKNDDNSINKINNNSGLPYPLNGQAFGQTCMVGGGHWFMILICKT